MGAAAARSLQRGVLGPLPRLPEGQGLPARQDDRAGDAEAELLLEVVPERRQALELVAGCVHGYLSRDVHAHRVGCAWSQASSSRLRGEGLDRHLQTGLGGHTCMYMPLALYAPTVPATQGVVCTSPRKRGYAPHSLGHVQSGAGSWLLDARAGHMCMYMHVHVHVHVHARERTCEYFSS